MTKYGWELDAKNAMCIGNLDNYRTTRHTSEREKYFGAYLKNPGPRG